MRKLARAAVLCGAPLWLAAAARTPSGNASIDRAREEAAASPTTQANAAARAAYLYSWFRLLMHQGVDLREFESVRLKLGEGRLTPDRFPSIAEGYRVLERIQAEPKRIPVKAGVSRAASGAATDWPLFHKNAAQTGYTDDPGPSQGKLAWRFPIGHGWYARPSIENGRVYIASPGLYTIAYALEEKTGAVLWAARQNGHNLYRTPRVSSPVVVLKDHIVVRETGSGGEVGEARHLVYIDKATGRVVKEEPAGHVDYRRGYAPIAGSQQYIALPAGYQWIQGKPPLVWMLNTVVLKDAPSGKTLWTLRTGDLFGEPVIDGGRVYAAAEPGVLYALNIAGEQRIAWQYRAGAPLRGTPAVTADTIYTGANDGTLAALDKQSGRPRWTWRAAAAEDRAFVFFSTPLEAGGRVYVGAADRRLYALDAATGALLWSHEMSDWFRSRPLAVGNRVYAAAMDGSVAALENGRLLWRKKVSDHQILADLAGNAAGVLVSTSDLYLRSLDPATGREQWRHSLVEAAYINRERYTADIAAGGADYQSSPAVVEGRVFIGAPNRFVYAVDAQTGRELWRYETSGQVSGTPIHAGGKVFFGQQGGDEDFYAVDAATGRLAWKRPLGWAWVGAGYADGNLFVGTVEGEVHCVRAADGGTVWTRATNGGVYPAPAVDAHNVYTGSWDGHFYALDRRTGGLRWAFHLGGSPDSAAPVLWKGMVLIQALSRNLHALDAATGRERWRYNVPQGWKMNGTPAAHGNRVLASIYIDNNATPIGATLMALDDATGNVLWRYPGGGSLTGAAIARNAAYFGSTNHVFLTSVDLDGNLLWRYQTKGEVYESCPAIYGGRMFVLVSDGYLYALD